MKRDVFFWIVMALVVGGCALLVFTNPSGNVFGMESGRFAGVVFFGVWALVLGSVFVGSRFRRAHALRNAAIWLLIVVGLVAAYQYRFALAERFGLTGWVEEGSPNSIKIDSNEDYI